MHINWTQIAGLVAFIPACLAALAAGRQNTLLRPSWTAVGAIYGLLAIEAATRTRYEIAERIRQSLRNAGLYSDRRPIQAIALLILIALAALIAGQLVRNAPTRAAAMGRAATAILVALFAAESISLHVIDGVVYSRAGPILLIGWLWLGCGWVTAVAATTDCVLAGPRSG